MAVLAAGPLLALIGIGVVFFVLRRKSVEKRSMYSARRSQIEHKVRAARQRTLTPRGRAQKPQEQTIPAADASFAPQAPQATVTWATPAYEAPPVAPPTAPPYAPPSAPPPPPMEEAPTATPWDVPAAASSAAPTFDYPPAPSYEPPAPDSTPMAPSAPAWTPAPAPAAEPAAQLEPTATAASSTAAGAWSIVNQAGESAQPEQDGKKKKKDRDKAGAGAATGDWSLASGDTAGAEADEPESRRPSGATVAVLQYVLLVIGLMAVLIGVVAMVANAHVT